jgi:hypothetical protein
MKDKHVLKSSTWKIIPALGLILMLSFCCTPEPNAWENVNEEGAFLVYRRQSLIGEETYSITSNKDSIVVKSLQGENERGRITGVQAELHLKMDLSPTYYVNRRLANGDTTNNFIMEVNSNEVSVWEGNFDVSTTATSSLFFPVHSNIPAAMEMMLYHYYFKQGKPAAIPTLPRGEISIKHTGQDIVQIKGVDIVLDRYVTEGINWGGRTIWLDESKNLIAMVKANTQIREMIRKGYEEALQVFIDGNVTEQMNALDQYTSDHK